jgi:hypothetical protein
MPPCEWGVFITFIKPTPWFLRSSFKFLEGPGFKDFDDWLSQLTPQADYLG